MNVQVKIGDQIYNVEVGDLSARPVLAKVEGETFEVWPEELATEEALPEKANVVVPTPVVKKISPTPVSAQRPDVATTPAAPIGGGNAGKVIPAPIPGVIVSVLVKPGDNVTKGQELIGLEAMKMKNAIRATRDGCIAVMPVSVGDHVQKGHPLVEFTD
jgi:biotin carboxyl carrier protein